MSPNKHQKDLPISIREDTPISSRMFLFKGVCLSLHFCFKVNQSIYFYFTLFIFYIRRIKITPTDLRRKLEIFQNTLEALICKRTCKRVSFQAVVFNNEFHIIPLLQHSQSLFERSISKYNLSLFPSYFRLTGGGIKLHFTVSCIIDQLLSGIHQHLFRTIVR